MMKFLRKKGVMKILLWGVAIVIILIFGVFSNAYLLRQDPGQLKYAGKVFGRKISVDDFNRNFQFTETQARMQYGQNFDQIADDLDLAGQTWKRIMLLEQARKEHIKISDNEVVEMIQRYPFFKNQKTGIFNQKIYQNVVRQGLRMTTRAFEEGVRDDLKIKELFGRKTFTASISDEEILEVYKKFNEKVRVSYVLFPAEAFKKKVSYDEIKAKNYFIEHKRDFIQPASIKVAYLRFPFQSDNDDSKNQAYSKAFNALAKLRSGQTFAEVSDEYGATIQKTDFFNLQKPDLALGWPLDAFQNLAKMRLGQYSEIVTTPSSYDILQLNETRPAFHPPYNDIKEQVKEAYLKYEALTLSKERAEDIRAQFDPQGDFAAAAQQLGLDVHETPEFNFGQYLPVIGPSLAFQQAAFALSQDNPLSDAVETEKGYAIIHFEERLPVDMVKYTEEKDAFGQQLLMRKKMNMFQEYTENLANKANIEDLISKNEKR